MSRACSTGPWAESLTDGGWGCGLGFRRAFFLRCGAFFFFFFLMAGPLRPGAFLATGAVFDFFRATLFAGLFLPADLAPRGSRLATEILDFEKGLLLPAHSSGHAARSWL